MTMRTLICASCGNAWERPAQTGQLPKKCPSCRVTPEAAHGPRDLICDECRRPFQWRKAGQAPKRCSDECKRAFNARRNRIARAEGRVRPRQKTEKAPRIRTCRYCGLDFAAKIAVAEVCYSKTCQRRKDRERHKVFRDQFSAQHGRAYVPESYRDKKRAHGKARRARLRNVETEVFLDVEIYERDGWTCGLCKEPVDPSLVWPHRMSASLDHITPIILGGTHTKDNVQLAHLSCNSAEGSFWRDLAREGA